MVYGNDDRVPNRYIGLAQTSWETAYPTLICIFTVQQVTQNLTLPFPSRIMLSRLKCLKVMMARSTSRSFTIYLPDDDGDYDGDYDGDRKIETFGLALPSNFS